MRYTQRALLGFLTLFITVNTSEACFFERTPEELGRFTGNVTGVFIEASYVDRPLFQLTSKLSYEHPDGQIFSSLDKYTVDGASIPRIFWSFIGGPFSGNHLKASVIHDYYTDTCQIIPHKEEGRKCENKLETYFEDDVVHHNYYLGMLAEGVPKWTACAEYLAVKAHKKWDLDENGHPENIRILGRAIERVDKDYFEKSLKLTKSSALGAVKALKASNGKLLNIFPETKILANEEGLDDYIARLTLALNEEKYSINSDVLGLLTNEQVESVENIKPWVGNFEDQKFDATTNTFRDLTYLDPSQPYDGFSLAEILNFQKSKVTLVPQVDWGVADNITAQSLQSVMRDRINLQEAIRSNDNISEEDLVFQELDEQPGYSYELSYELRKHLNAQADNAYLGAGGTITLQERADGLNEVFIEAVPLR